MLHKTLLKKLLFKWKLIKSIESLFLSMLAFSISLYIFQIELTLFITLSFFLIHTKRNHVFSFSLNQLCIYLNNTYPSLEFSSQLLLQDQKTLNDIALFQYEKIGKAFSNLNIKLPFNVVYSAGCAILSLIVFTLPSNIQSVESAVVVKTGEKKILSIQSKSVSVQPPTYTKKIPFHSADLNVSAPEFSNIQWSVEAKQKVMTVNIQLYNGNKVTLESTDSIHFKSNQVTLNQSTFYSILVVSLDSTKTESPFFKATILRDNIPEIDVSIKKQYQTHDMVQNPTFSFNTTLSDDYGIRNAFLVATVSKGKGESVKFREKSILLKVRKTKLQTIPYTFFFKDFQITPGDEIYFYIIAQDNNPIRKQLSRSETYFIAIEDTSSESLTFSGGLTVNQMPAYFRSQRQIIIDTEKLIAKQPSISSDDFLREGNEIGYDQKVLRLKYGKFLGDEFESEPTLEAFGDAHHEDDGHDHSIAESNSNKTEDILAPFVHDHDNAEQSTYFEPKTKAKLKAALEAMWSSELNLRIGTPKDALPFQHKALKLIKEVREDSRIYVERIGFEPPPINVKEQRLKGETEEIRPETRTKKREHKKSEDIKKFVLWLENGSYENTPNYLNNVITEVSNYFLNTSINYSKTLLLLKKIKQREQINFREKKKLQSDLYSILKQNNTGIENTYYQRTILRESYHKKVGGSF